MLEDEAEVEVVVPDGGGVSEEANSGSGCRRLASSCSEALWGLMVHWRLEGSTPEAVAWSEQRGMPHAVHLTTEHAAGGMSRPPTTGMVSKEEMHAMHVYFSGASGSCSFLMRLQGAEGLVFFLESFDTIAGSHCGAAK